MDRDSFVFYASFHKALSGLPPDDYKQTLVAVCEYALFGKEPDLQGIPFMAFELIRPQIDANNKKYQNGIKGAEYGKLGGRPKKKTSVVMEENPLGVIEENPIGVTDETPNVNVNENVNVNVNDINVGKTKRFTPPTAKQVKEYASEKGCPDFPADRFVDFYESKGWMVGKNKMKDWKAAVRTWLKDKQQKQQSKYVNYGQRQTDYDSIFGLK